MKVFLIIFLLPIFFFSQSTKVYFHRENDSTISYRDENNNYIIKPFVTKGFLDDEGAFNNEILGNFFYINPKNESQHAVNRKGDFLFYPYFFDNGPDYLKENYFRIQDEKGKVGFANSDGEITIKPQYDYASSFVMGFSSYCNGCYLDRTKDPEHPPLVGGKWGFIDKFGKEITTTNSPKGKNDFKTENGKFIPYQFVYSNNEKSILKKLAKYKKGICANNIFGDGKINFEIIDRPSEAKPFYFIKIYRKDQPYYYSTDNDDAEGFNFFIDKNQNIFVNHLISNDGGKNYQNSYLKIEDWIKSEK